MKILLLVLALATAGGAYYFYSEDQGNQLKARAVASVQDDQIHALQATVSELKTHIADLQGRLAKSQDEIARLKAAEVSAAVVQPTAVPASSPSPLPPASPAPLPGPALSEFPSTLTTSNGRTYAAVKLISHDAARVIILDSDGGATLQISTLAPEVQRYLGYDPEKAKSVEAADEAADAASENALERERQQADQKSQAAVSTSPPPSFTPATVATPPKLTEAEIASIKKQIQDLQDDIAFMQREEAKLCIDGRTLRTNGGKVSHGGYPDKISQEQDQIRGLQNQLNQH